MPCPFENAGDRRRGVLRPHYIAGILLGARAHAKHQLTARSRRYITSREMPTVLVDSIASRITEKPPRRLDRRAQEIAADRTRAIGCCRLARTCRCRWCACSPDRRPPAVHSRLRRADSLYVLVDGFSADCIDISRFDAVAGLAVVRMKADLSFLLTAGVIATGQGAQR